MAAVASLTKDVFHINSSRDEGYSSLQSSPENENGSGGNNNKNHSSCSSRSKDRKTRVCSPTPDDVKAIEAPSNSRNRKHKKLTRELIEARINAALKTMESAPIDNTSLLILLKFINGEKLRL